jgi:hypothetical protein
MFQKKILVFYKKNEKQYDEQVFGDSGCRHYQIEGTFIALISQSLTEYG